MYVDNITRGNDATNSCSSMFMLCTYSAIKCLTVYPLMYICVVAPYDVTISADFSGDIMARPVTVEHGDTLTLTFTASGGTDNMFHWYKDGSYLEGVTDGILNITDVTADDGGLYECIVNNTAGSSSANFTIYGRACISHNTQHMLLFSCSTDYY